MSDVQVDDCPDCHGLGFRWKHGYILDHKTGAKVADTRTRGEACTSCFGTGERTRPLMSSRQILIGAVCCLPLLVLFWFLLQL